MRTLPGTLGATPVRAEQSTSRSDSSTVRTTPHGTPAASSSAIQCAAVRSAIRALIVAITRPRSATRPALAVRRGSSDMACKPERASARAPLRIVADGDDERPIARLEQLVRNEIRMSVPPPLRLLAADERVLRDVHQRGARASGERDGDVSPASRSRARNERGEDRDARVLPGDDVRQCDADFHWCAVRITGDGHPPLLGLHDEVVSGAVAVRTEARDRAPHELRMRGEDVGDVKSVSGEHASLEVVDDDIGTGDERADELAIRHGLARSAARLFLLRLTLR